MSNKIKEFADNIQQLDGVLLSPTQTTSIINSPIEQEGFTYLFHVPEESKITSPRMDSEQYLHQLVGLSTPEPEVEIEMELEIG